MTTSLLIIDTQKGMFAFPEFQPNRARETLDAIAGLLARARATGTPVVFVKHDGPDGPLALGQPLHEIADEIAPRASETVITKSKCGAFHETALKQALLDIGATELVICGLQTDFCVDTAIRTAPEHGFKVIAAKGAHSTFETPFAKAPDIVAHHEYVWPRQFGRLVPAEEINFSA